MEEARAVEEAANKGAENAPSESKAEETKTETTEPETSNAENGTHGGGVVECREVWVPNDYMYNACRFFPVFVMRFFSLCPSDRPS